MDSILVDTGSGVCKADFQLATPIAAIVWTCLYQLGLGKPRGSSLPLSQILKPGMESSTYGLIYNPRFAEWLIGWPIGWTDTDSPVTGLCPWKRRVRSRLCRYTAISDR